MYPARFREEYSDQMERQFQDELQDLDPRQRTPFALRTLWDFLKTAPLETARELRMDLAYALRVHRKRPGPALLAVVALGLAIGAGTAGFSVISALLLRALPFHDAGRLVEVRRASVTAMHGRSAFTQWRQNHGFLDDAAAFTTSEMNLAGERESLRVTVTETSSNFFSLLGAKLIGGRAFDADEDKPGSAHPAVISYALWQQYFAGSPSALGTTIRLNGAPLVICGITAPEFDYPSKTSIWVSSGFDFEVVPKTSSFWLQTVGRLKTGVTLSQARQMLDAEASSQGPDERPELLPLRELLAGELRNRMIALCGIVLAVLLAACANVAQLLSSQTVERQQELSIRASLGATRGRLIQQLLTEALTHALGGAVLGILTASWGAKWLSTIAPPQISSQEYTIVDWRVLLFSVLLVVFSAVAAGLAPAWFAARFAPHRRDTQRLRWFRDGLIVTQSLFTIVLLSGAFTLGRSFLSLLHTDLGFAHENAVTLRVSLQGSQYAKADTRRLYYAEALSRIRKIDGVEAAGAVRYLPLVRTMLTAGTFKLDSGAELRMVLTNGATPGYFEATRTRLLAGRLFDAHDGERHHVLVNAAFVEQARLTPGEAIGRSIAAAWSKQPYTIVGVVDSARIAGPEFPASSQIFWHSDEDPPSAMMFIVRTRGDARQFLARCRDTVRSVDPGIPVYDLQTLDDRLDGVLAAPKFHTTAVLFFGCLSLFLAVLGIHGAATYAAERRKQEAGIRIALGSTNAGIRALFVRDGMRPVLFGTTVGIFFAAAASKWIASLIEGGKPADPLVYLMSCGGLLLTAVASILLATRRISSLDAVTALRTE